MRTPGPQGWMDGWGGGGELWGEALLPHRNAALPVSEAPKEAPTRKFVPASVYLEEKSDEQKKEEVGAGTPWDHPAGGLRLGAMPQASWLCPASLQLLNAMVARLGNRDDPLPQDSFEGVDEDEWVGAGGRGGGAGTTPAPSLSRHAPHPHRASRRTRLDPGSPRTTPVTPAASRARQGGGGRAAAGPGPARPG